MARYLQGNRSRRCSNSGEHKTAASRCAIGGKLLLWMCCDGTTLTPPGGTETSFLKPMDGWDQALTGEDLKAWTFKMDPSCTLTVVLEVCGAGNFMTTSQGRPYQWAAYYMYLRVPQ
ncbi:hypothetical protein FRB94_005549 [Tulasnella sp. JGI-2019a]|nr:hypothetical protein FRB93_006032 [Tulasnella sp. JGI-2019a]KAG9012613.1 hypothetical protein FRB94_005549 [Tulasnella sp. JGI-2019a]